MTLQSRTRRRSVLASPPDRFPRYALLPLRLFLAVTFFYAGIQKLTDPGYFTPGAPTYIGSQMASFAAGSPIGFLFQWVALPFPTQVGWAVIIAEIGIGVLTFVGLFTRLAATIGAFLSLSLFLSATWDVQPYFLGSDSIYAVAWITMVIAGDGGVFSLGSLLSGGQRLYEDALLAGSEIDRGRRRTLLQLGGAAVALVWVLGLLPREQASADNTPASSPVAATTPTDTAPGPTADSPAAAVATANPTVDSPTAPPSITQTPSAVGTVEPTAAATNAVTAVVPTATHAPAVAASPTPAGTLIASLSQLQRIGALAYTDPQSGDPAVVIDLGGNKVVAYSAVCTHAGCTVHYSAAGQSLNCPCHGAMFDPAHNGEPLRGPARRPLTELKVTVAADGKIYAM